MVTAIVLLLAIGSACGKMPGVLLEDTTFTPRIIRGENASIDEFPYMVSLEYSVKQHACGASILTKNWVLTAAHCCVVGTKDTLYIYAGSINLFQGGSKHNIEKFIVHENYQPNNRWRNDICLIRVSQPFTFGRSVQQITLPPQDWKVESGDKLTICGWGYTVPDEDDIPIILQKGVNFVALNEDECIRRTGINMFPGYICAVGGIEGQGVCNGDSGSPLVKEGVQVGIASWTFLPCGNDMPDIYCRVPNYINWIKEKLGREASELKFL